MKDTVILDAYRTAQADAGETVRLCINEVNRLGLVVHKIDVSIWSKLQDHAQLQGRVTIDTRLAARFDVPIGSDVEQIRAAIQRMCLLCGRHIEPQ